jgi:chromosome segregation ATPase
MGEAEGPTAGDERARVHQRYRKLLAEYKSVNAELSDLSWTLAELEQQIGGLLEEYAAHPERSLERRLRDLRRWKESLEESVLRHMYRAEELADLLTEMRRTIADLPVDAD